VNPKNISISIELHNCMLFFPAVQTSVLLFSSFSNTCGYSVQCIWYTALCRPPLSTSTLSNSGFLEKGRTLKKLENVYKQWLWSKDFDIKNKNLYLTNVSLAGREVTLRAIRKREPFSLPCRLQRKKENKSFLQDFNVSNEKCLNVYCNLNRCLIV